MAPARFKYPRTPHLPWSPGATSDDIFAANLSHFEGQEVVVLEKMDGENSSLYHDYFHARSLDGRHHPSRNWVKGLHGQIAHLIPPGWRLCGENLYARHSIAYENLQSFFYLFSLWDERNHCLDWDETLDWAALMDLATPPAFYRGPWDEVYLRSLEVDTTRCEGYVVRTVQGFAYEDFTCHVAKWVREAHVQSDSHWMHLAIVPNRLAGEAEAED
jgi:hypothetical protein